MSFKESVEIDNLEQIINQIYEYKESIKEFGYVTIHHEQVSKLKERSEKLQKLLKECEEEMERFCDEIQDWYGY